MYFIDLEGKTGKSKLIWNTTLQKNRQKIISSQIIIVAISYPDTLLFFTCPVAYFYFYLLSHDDK